VEMDSDLQQPRLANSSSFATMMLNPLRPNRKSPTRDVACVSRKLWVDPESKREMKLTPLMMTVSYMVRLERG
jgi:hypothetical protein